ncbi:MAG TPA: S8 family serine peptidase, partial [Candidatus Woesebacteria bacterium]|nr:S8 family serine peptidase [Candidatus Woesebacteria bacterium]
MSKKKSLLAIFSLTIVMLTVGLVLYNTKTVDAKTTNEKVQQLLKDGYEYDLTKLLVVKKGSKDPELVFLEEQEYQGAHVSSKKLKENDKDLAKNRERFEKLEKKLTELTNDKNIEHVQPVYLYSHEVWTRDELLDTPDNFDLTPLPATGNHWYYEKSNLRSMWYDQDCFNGGTECGGSNQVVVAVIDTGLAFEDYTSVWSDIGSTPFDFDPAPDMFVGDSINLWTNTSEIENNDIDDDGNGFIDDYHGVNMENYVYCETYVCTTEESGDTGHPNDDGGHGTFVTGLITSLVGNGANSVSPAHNVSIMTIKANYYKSPKFGTTELIESINYAVDNGADIINMSLAGGDYDSLLEQAINNAHDAGVLVIASSGNSYASVLYPAKYENVLAVGAVNSNNTKSNYSSYGPELDLVAYVGSGTGEGITTYQQSYSCFFAQDDNCYLSNDPTRYTSFDNYYAQGTSFASPQVAAAAAIILGNNFGMRSDQIRLALLSSVNDIGPVGFDNYTGHGVIDYKKANDFSTGTEEVENLTVYRYIDGDGGWIWVGNPDLVNPVYVYLSIGG